MKVSINWLNEHVDVGDVGRLCELLTFAGVEVEGVERTGVEPADVVVGRILSSEPHSNADRLSVCRVDVGAGGRLQIVCGAKNYRVGDKVPVALPGAVLPGGFKIKKGKLRGEVSEGMMCSAKELGAGGDASGLWILDTGADVGTPLSEVVKGDTVLELEITPNRSDLLSYAGIAREVAALTGGELRVRGSAVLETTSAEEGLGIVREAGDACPFYTATRIEGVAVGPSPSWLREHLESVGLRPVNNIVDITNYILLETGQPLHAFDADKLQGGITVRMAGRGECIKALDGGEYSLGESHLVIADDARVVAIAGVMGGEETGVEGGTRTILLESALFRASSVRRTSRELGLMSDSSYRFERGVDSAGVLPAAARAVELIRELAGGALAGPTAVSGGVEAHGLDVRLREATCNRVMGYEVGRGNIEGILSGFGLEKLAGDETSTTWRVPTFRPDLAREIDLVEEVARVEGLDKVPESRSGFYSQVTEADVFYNYGIVASRYLAGAGFYEARTLSLLSEEMLKDDVFAQREVLRLKNPLGADSAALRPSLLPGLLKCLAYNVRQGAGQVRIFEVGRVFSASGSEETTQLAIAMAGRRLLPHWETTDEGTLDIFDLKGVFESMPFASIQLEPRETGSAVLAMEMRLGGDRVIGHLGQIAPARARELGVDWPILVAEFDLHALSGWMNQPRAFREFPRFPAITRDIALIVPNDIPHARIVSVIKGAGEDLLADLRVFDVFSDPAGEKTPENARSVAYSLTYRHPERTLSSEEASAAHQRIAGLLESRLGLTARV